MTRWKTFSLQRDFSKASDSREGQFKCEGMWAGKGTGEVKRGSGEWEETDAMVRKRLLEIKHFLQGNLENRPLALASTTQVNQKFRFVGVSS